MSDSRAQQKHAFPARRLEWPVPLMQTHEGVPLSNGTFGALVWGDGRRLRVTVNRADYWDHRGGMDFPEEATYTNLRRLLEARDERGLREVFERSSRAGPRDPARPTRLPMGRVDLQFPGGSAIVGAGLDLAAGRAEVELALPTGSASLQAAIAPGRPLLALSLRGAGPCAPELLLVPPDAPEVLDYFRRYGFPEPRLFDDGDFRGWVQECPGEPALCMATLRRQAGTAIEFLVTSVYGDTRAEAVEQARLVLARAAHEGYAGLAAATAEWWAQWWSATASISLPSPELELLYYLGIYKLAGLTPPGSPAASLQGPWIEEYRMPPWQGDYHFNVNAQECYWPAFACGHPETLEPLVELLDAWQPKLCEYAARFAEVSDGLLLPHAVDDRCTCMGGFWTGSIDDGSTAWTAQLLWLYYRYTLNTDFLRDTAYPFMKGAMRVYEVMLEDTGDAWRLPVSVSPEFGGSGMDAWGANASYQLAAIHFLCRALVQASQLLGLDDDKRALWRDVDARLPAASTDPSGAQIHLWEGQPLSESHRHHSHLAGLYPFDTLDYSPGGAQEALARNSLRHLTDQGMGRWTGWCMPWASILFARAGNGDMAELLLHIYRRVFMNRGYASTHDAQFPGFTVMDGRPSIMQIEAALGAAAAVIEMLLHTRAGVLHVFPALPAYWTDASFQGLHAEGAFVVSARLEASCCRCVTIESLAGHPLRLANPWGERPVRVESEAGSRTVAGRIVEIETRPGEVLTLYTAAGGGP